MSDFDVPKGKQYTSTLDFPQHARRGGAVLEDIIRPFTSYTERRDQALAKLRAAPGDETDEILLCFGQPQEFQFTDAAQLGLNGTTGTGNSEDEEDPQDEQTRRIRTWTETSRRVKRIKIVNPDDEDQFVYVLKTLDIMFDGPDGNCHLFKFNPPSDANER